jgi:hypothetical protein
MMVPNGSPAGNCFRAGCAFLGLALEAKDKIRKKTCYVG